MARSRRRQGGAGDAAAAFSNGASVRRRGGGMLLATASSRGRVAGLLLVLALQLLVLACQPATAASAGAKGVAWWLRPFHRGPPAAAAVDATEEEPQRRWWGVVRRGGAVRGGGAAGKGKGGGSGKKKETSDAGVLVGKKKGGNGGGGRVELESEDEMGTLVIGPEAGGAVEEDGAGTATRAVPGGVSVEVEETEEALVGYASGGGDDDDEAAAGASAGGGGDDDGLGGPGGDGGGDGGRWSYLEELEEEEEPEWVAAYAALEESIEDPPQARRVDSREEARAILRQAWARLAIPPQQAAAGAAAEGAEAGGTEADEDGAHYAGSPFARQSKAAARRELYKRFLKDLGTDTRALGGRHWLDRDALVHLRGTALLCQRPEYGELLASLHPRFCRGVRLVVPTATHGMQEALAAALAHSVGAVLVVADHRRIAAVRRIALDAGVPKRLLGSEMVMGALLDLARGEEKALLRQGGRRSVLAGARAEDGEEEDDDDEEEEDLELTELAEDEDEEGEGESEDEDKAAASGGSAGAVASSSPPLVIFLADKARPFLQTRGVASALQAALTARDASSFFLLASEYDPDSQLPPLPNGGNGGHAHGGAHHHHPHPHFGAAGGLLAPPGSNLLSGDGPLPNMTTLLGGGQSPDGSPQQPPQQQQPGAGPPRFGPNGLPGLMMPWPGMPHAPNFNKGGPVLHVLIRPNLVPSPNANAPGNGSVGVQGYVPGVPGANLGTSPNPNAPPPGVSGFSPLFKRTVAELAEHFNELSRERLSESQGQGQGQGQGQQGGANASGAAGQAEEGTGPAASGAGEEEADREEDEDEDDDEDVDSQEYKDRAAAEGSALAQLAAMLEMLNSNENFHRALQAHVNAQHQHLQHLGLHGGAGMPMHGMPPPPGAGPLRPPPPPGAPGGPGGGPPQLTMGPDGVPLFNGVPMLPAYQITFAFPPLNTQPPPPPPAQRERNSAAAAAATPPSAGGQQQQQDGKGLPFARWFGKNRGEAAAGDEGSSNGNGGGGGRRGKRKGGRGGRGGSSSSSSKEAAGPQAASELPVSGAEQEELLALFEDVVLQPTKDAALRARWDRLVSDDHERYNAKRAWATLRHALGSHRLLCPDLARANPLLYKVQLKPGAEASRVMATAVEVDVSRRPLPRVVTEDGAFHLLSLEALETALAVVCKASVPRPGTPVSRTREEVTALAQNRHEHALVSNVISPQDIGITYDMIGGLEDVKETLRQCVTYPLRFPHLYAEGIAADSVKGVLLFGPPGTGKTMLAKAVATEGGATFLSVDASVIESKWLGESEKNAKAVFTLARRLAPCVIYLDEVDSILSSRDQGEDTKYNTITSVKTTFMQEWDGLRTTADRVIVVASTNRPYALDQAVLRRMPRRILVDLPDQATREEMLRVILQRNRVAPEVNLTAVARRLEGYTGSDIREVCREAVVRIAHEESKKLDDAQQGVVVVSVDALGKRLRPVTKADFDAALEKLSASVAARGRELERVREWNSQFGEVRKKQKPPHLSMYL